MTALATTTAEPPVADGKIVCMIDGARTHSIPTHLKNFHPDWSMDRYRETYPDAPVASEHILELARKRKLEKEQAEAAKAPAPHTLHLAGEPIEPVIAKAAFHELFELKGKAAKARNGNAINVSTFSGYDAESAMLIPDIDQQYVFSIEDTKDVVIALELGSPCYIWGYHGTGKTTIIDQVHARVRRAMLRVQHTMNTEESDIIGQWTVRNGDTHFQLGPLAMAMLKGWSYLADEYDFALPSVTAVYQPVLEGKPLVIKNAPPELRVIRPHPNFRFFATGNTNGVGDESGLYQGTQMGNAANYSRFQITVQMDYMPEAMEKIVVSNQSRVQMEDAEKIVGLCTSIRRAYAAGQIGSTISPREAITIGILGLTRGNFLEGFKRAYLNRLSRVDKEVVGQFAQRVWG